jgi:hypothetical protein
MHHRRIISVGKLKEYFNQKTITHRTLNRLFYYSLFDSGSFEADEMFWPIDIIRERRESTRRMLMKIFNKKEQPRFYEFLNPERFDEFDKRVISSDILSRIILQKQLRMLGERTFVENISTFDLEHRRGRVKIELKRICQWTNYSDYLTSFLEKVNDDERYIFVVACTHPMRITSFLNDSDLMALNKYMENVFRSHYVIERLLSKDNIKFIIKHICESGSNGHNLLSLCEKIKEKINEFGD